MPANARPLVTVCWVIVDKDRVDLRILDDWWHTEDGSCEDNQNKEEACICLGTDSVTGEKACDAHFRRSDHGTLKESLSKFQASEHAVKLKEATKTAKRPDGVKVGVKLLRKARMMQMHQEAQRY